MIVIKKDLDWVKQQIRQKLLEHAEKFEKTYILCYFDFSFLTAMNISFIRQDDN